MVRLRHAFLLIDGVSRALVDIGKGLQAGIVATSDLACGVVRLSATRKRDQVRQSGRRRRRDINSID